VLDWDVDVEDEDIEVSEGNPPKVECQAACAPHATIFKVTLSPSLPSTVGISYANPYTAVFENNCASVLTCFPIRQVGAAFSTELYCGYNISQAGVGTCSTAPTA
jgi:hypothetical protein